MLTTGARRYRVSALAGAATCLAVLFVAGVGATVPTSRAEASPSPASIGLQPSDVPGYSPVDPSVLSLTDIHDQGLNQAFVQCAANTPLLSQFGTGPDATISQMYGQGTNPYGSPVLAVGTAVFTDGSAADAFTAWSALSGAAFRQCWASTQDALNTQQGITVPERPTTVATLATPAYGAGSAAFEMNLDYNVLGSAVTSQITATIVDSGSIVTMIVTYAYETSFPESLRLSVLEHVAARMGASPGRQTPPPPTSGHGACVAPAATPPVTLLSDAEVVEAFGHALRYDGWQDSQNGSVAAAGTVTVRDCMWTDTATGAGFPAPGGTKTQPAVFLTVSSPYGVGGAKSAFSSAMSGWGARSFSGLGDSAFWLPYQDVANAVEVLTGDRIVSVGVEAPVGQLAHSRQVEMALAKLVVDRLGAGAPANFDAGCLLKASLGYEPKWIGDLNTKLQKAAKAKLPVSVATVKLPAGLFMNLAPSFEPGDFTFCVVGTALTGYQLLEPLWDPSGASSLDFKVEAEGEAKLGPFAYSSELASWTSVDKADTPSDQQFGTRFDLAPELQGDLGIDLSHEGLETDFTIAELVIASDEVTIKLVVRGSDTLEVSLGPKLALDLQVSKKNLVDELGKDLTEDPAGGEKAAAEDVSKQVADDAVAASEADGEAFYGYSYTDQLAARLDSEIDSQLLDAFDAWFKGLQAGSPDAQELADQGVTPDEVPPDAAAALEGETAGESDLFYKFLCDALFGGPEDPLGDAACFG